MMTCFVSMAYGQRKMRYGATFLTSLKNRHTLANEAIVSATGAFDAVALPRLAIPDTPYVRMLIRKCVRAVLLSWSYI